MNSLSIKKYITQFMRLKSVLTQSQNYEIMDRVTGLPTLVSLYNHLGRVMASESLGLIYVDIANFNNIESLYGRDVCEQVLHNFGNFLSMTTIVFYGPRYTHGVCSLGGDDFLIFLDAPKKQDYFKNNYIELKGFIEELLNSSIKHLKLDNRLQVHLGYANILRSTSERIESVVYKAIKEASYSAKNPMNETGHQEWQLFKQMLHHEDIRSLFQPIVSLKNGNIYAFEALSRGPSGTKLESPLNLFGYAEKYNCLLELEKVCLKNAVLGAYPDIKNRYLFLNINPVLLTSLNIDQGKILDELQAGKIRLKNIVLELTERNGINDFATFRDKLKAYRRLGIQVAIDDAGSGYSSLQAIAELLPEYVKMDMSLVRDIDKNPTKKALLETFVDFTYKIGSRVICEGIETNEELDTLASMGCDYGQGFLLGRPGRIEEEIEKNIKTFILQSTRSGQYYHDIPARIGDIVMYQDSISPDTTVEDLVKRFNENTINAGLVVAEDDYPTGLVMRDRLFSTLGTRYGYDLFVKKQVTQVMDKDPLLLPWFTSLDDAARQVAERLSHGINDYVIITREEKYQGVVSVSQLLDTLAAIQLEQAKDSNPLTGLPGNRLLTRRITEEVKLLSDFMILYFDLDNFKAFNDKFGFEHGDRAIILLANILVEVTQKHGNPTDLISHIGGDDFVILTTADKGDELAALILQIFDERIIHYYDDETLKRGYFIGQSRTGEQINFPIMSLSAAAVVNKPGNKFANHLAVGEVAAELKKVAKSQPGSCYIRDRRLLLNNSRDDQPRHPPGYCGDDSSGISSEFSQLVVKFEPKASVY